MAILSMAPPVGALPLDAVAQRWRGYARSLMNGLARERPQTDRNDELALVERARRGDLDAQRELVERLLPQLRAVSNALLGRTADADDAVQIALMRVLENLASWRGDAALRHWARRVAANVCLRMSEQNRRHARAVGDETDLEALDTSAPEEAFPEMLPGTVHAYLERLPTVQREAVVLRHALGYSVEEIAELSGTAVGTVKSRLLCGRQALRKLIRRDDAVDDLAAGLRRRAQR
ncbi:MAG TPA: sigma-70 family RNA polymerase sigma factor [Nannocystaceae bacterium]|nr:sigma-70 family RNA polymerase sigma factor [Nannocystaceae bacterium]